jgi:hypothetical protein
MDAARARTAHAAIFTNRITTEPKSGADELADRQTEETKKRLAAVAEVNKRLSDLRVTAAEEEYPISRESLKALKIFLNATTFTKRPYIALLDSGNLRALWEDRAAGEQIGLQFLGGDTVQFVIFARRADEGFIARSAGRDLITNIQSQIEANGLRRLMS